MLPLFNQHPLIDDILIIDNDNKNTDTSLFELEKVAFILNKNNLYVNQSWNQGVSKSYYDRLCFYSDDVYFDPIIIDKVYPMIEENNGMIGFSSDIVFDIMPGIDLDYSFEESGPQIVPCEEMPYGYASTFFLHKRSYHTIPKEFKIFFGDTFLFHMNRKFAKKNYMISNFQVRTNMGTSSKLFKRITDKEWKVAESIFEQYGISKSEWLTNH
jgi:hypothetical protein